MDTADDPNGLARVDEVLITAELAHRPSRALDYAAENRALGALAQEMATNPGGVLQKCAELVLELCHADSAGISLLEPGGENGVFRGHAIAGRLAGYLGGTIPQDANLYGAVVARDRVLLVNEPERALPALRGIEPRIYETLLAPWHVKGEPIGSLWAIKHTPEGRFDAEDARLLQSLAHFAAAAYQMSDALDEAKAGQEARQKSESRFRLLSETIERLSTATGREDVLATVFHSARALTGADGVSLVVRDGDQCHYLAEDALGPLWSGQRFPLMSCVSGLAMVEGRTIVIPDIAADARVPQAAYEPTFVKSLVMVPIGNGSGAAAIGAYWARVRAPDPEEVEVLQALSRVAGARLLKREAEERLQESEERFRSLIESWAQAVWETDVEGKVITDSPSWRAYTGQSPEERLGNGWVHAIHPDDRPAVERLWCEAVRERRPLNTEHRLRRAAGGWRWTNVHAAPLLAPDGTVRKWVGMNIDITERKEAEEALRASESRAKLLLAELQHRVRNTLAVIRSIVRRTAETSKSVEDYAMHLEGRINAFARVQSAVARDPAAGLDLTALVADELLACVARESEQVRIGGPPVRLQPKAAETFGLAVHELATNAVKHGALLVPHGRIRISWHVQNGSEVPRLVFEWKESGAPGQATKRKRRGFGTDLLERTLAYELKAKTMQTFDPDGLRCTIELPLTKRIVMSGSAGTPRQD